MNIITLIVDLTIVINLLLLLLFFFSYRAGSRNETYDTQGVTHVLRLAAGLTTKKATSFGLTRNIQQLGGNLYATADRELISYTLQVTRNNLYVVKCFLVNLLISINFFFLK